MAAHEKIFCALDTPDLDRALSLATQLKGKIGGLKLGLEFFSALGPDGIKRISIEGQAVFLDLKLHDIPNTVAKAVHALAPLAPKMMTIHAGGGLAMMRAAKEASLEASDKLEVPAPMILGVTVLTSLDGNDLGAMGVLGGPEDQVLRLAKLAGKAGLDGCVCSPMEISKIRSELGPDLKLVVPGIRPAGADIGDQKRVLTPKEAVDKGADYLVIGRPITGAENPASAAQAIADSLK